MFFDQNFTDWYIRQSQSHPALKSLFKEFFKLGVALILHYFWQIFHQKKKTKKSAGVTRAQRILQGKLCVFLNRTQSRNTCEMFIVFCCLPQCHSKNCKPRVLVATSQKSLKERTQLCMSANVELLRYSETNNSLFNERHWSDQDWVKIYCYTQSLISMTRVVYAWQSPQKREGFSLLNLEG